MIVTKIFRCPICLEWLCSALFQKAAKLRWYTRATLWKITVAVRSRKSNEKIILCFPVNLIILG